MPSIYKLTSIREYIEEGDHNHYGFEIVGIIRKPVVRFTFDTREEAEKYGQQMNEAVTAAVGVTPLFVR
jgi:hypothetical protein